MPNTNPNFRQLCAELVDKIDYTWGHMPHDVHELMAEARAALAAEPQGVSEEVAELVAALRAPYRWTTLNDDQLDRAADLLARYGRQP